MEGPFPPLVLASTSPRRADLLRAAGFSFRVVAPEATESIHRHYSPRELVLLNAMRKCRCVARRFPGSLVVGADTVVAIDGMPIGKPPDLAAAHRMLSMLAGREHEVVSGVVLMHLQQSRRVSFIEISRVRMRPMAPEAIERYHARIAPLDKAGAYAAQDEKDEAVAQIEGSRTNVIGLPMERLVEVLCSL